MVEVKAVVELSVACKADGELSGCARATFSCADSDPPLVAADIEQGVAVPLVASAGRAARRCEELSRPGSAGEWRRRGGQVPSAAS
jgi:hypothetical protein